jgi:hypothetical protein
VGIGEASPDEEDCATKAAEPNIADTLRSSTLTYLQTNERDDMTEATELAKDKQASKRVIIEPVPLLGIKFLLL